MKVEVTGTGAIAGTGEPAVSRLEARGLQKSYGSRMVVKDVSLAVQKGEVVGLLGPNGAGKTTCFYMVVGLVRADAGSIRIDGVPVEHKPIHQRARMGLSYLPQEASIFAFGSGRPFSPTCSSSTARMFSSTVSLRKIDASCGR